MPQIVFLPVTSHFFQQIIRNLPLLVHYAWEYAQHEVAALHEEEVNEGDCSKDEGNSAIFMIEVLTYLCNVAWITDPSLVEIQFVLIDF